MYTLADGGFQMTWGERVDINIVITRIQKYRNMGLYCLPASLHATRRTFLLGHVPRLKVISLANGSTTCAYRSEGGPPDVDVCSSSSSTISTLVRLLKKGKLRLLLCADLVNNDIYMVVVHGCDVIIGQNNVVYRYIVYSRT